MSDKSLSELLGIANEPITASGGVPIVDRATTAGLEENDQIGVPTILEGEIIEPESKGQLVPIADPHEQESQDFALSRRVLQNVILTGEKALENIEDVAEESESPRAYEVLATVMKTLTDSAKDLYDMHKKKKDLHRDEGDRGAVNNIQVDKAVFIGSPSDLLTQIKKNAVS